jgi:hypothetical protein
MLLEKLVERDRDIENLFYGNQQLQLDMKKAEEVHAAEKSKLRDEIAGLKAEVARLSQKPRLVPEHGKPAV